MAQADPTLDRLHELADDVRRRDADALAEVHALTVQMLVAVAVTVVRDRELAQDVVQDAFLSLVDHCAEIRGDGYALRAWLVRTVRNRAIDVVRSARYRWEDVRDELPDAGDGDDVTERVLSGELDPSFLAAFAQLTDDQRVALVLTHVVGLSGAEVGDALGRSRAAVYLLLQRAVRRMRTLLPDPFDVIGPDRLSDGTASVEEG